MIDILVYLGAGADVDWGGCRIRVRRRFRGCWRFLRGEGFSLVGHDLLLLSTAR